MALAIRKQAFEPIPKAKPAKKPEYLSWLHTLPCCISGRMGVQAAHVSFANPYWGCYGRAKGTKVPDLFALPLSPQLHELQHSGKLGAEEAFWAHHGIDPHELCVTLWALYSMYDEHIATERATARIMMRRGV